MRDCRKNRFDIRRRAAVLLLVLLYCFGAGAVMASDTAFISAEQSVQSDGEDPGALSENIQQGEGSENGDSENSGQENGDSENSGQENGGSENSGQETDGSEDDSLLIDDTDSFFQDDDDEEAVDKPENNVVKLAYRTVRPKGKLTRKGKKYCYILSNGSRLKNKWLKIGKYIYYFGNDGNAWTGSHRYKGKQYFFDKKGHLYIRKLRKQGKDRYFYGKDGAMVRGRWQSVRGHYYYFSHSGKMARSKWVMGCYLKANGRMDYTKGRGSTKRYKSSGGKDKLVIIGASRVWQMSKAVETDSNVIYIAKSGEGLSWFKRTALKKLKKTLKKYPKSKVVIQMGNNDLTRKNAEVLAGKYASIYKSLIRKYPKASFYFMDILPKKPVNSAKNSCAKKFNACLAKRFPKQYIGGYSYMVNEGFITSYNKSHYSVKTSRDIFNYILKKVKK